MGINKKTNKPKQTYKYKKNQTEIQWTLHNSSTCTIFPRTRSAATRLQSPSRRNPELSSTPTPRSRETSPDHSTPPWSASRTPSNSKRLARRKYFEIDGKQCRALPFDKQL